MMLSDKRIRPFHPMPGAFLVFGFWFWVFCSTACPAPTAPPPSEKDSLEKLEATKCRLLRARLLKAGAVPHALPVLERVPLLRLATDEVLLSFVKMGGHYLRFVVRSGGVSTLNQLSVKRLDRMVIAARDELEHGPLDGKRAKELLAALSKALLQGAGPALRTARRLLILPDGMLRLAPYHILPLDGEPLAARLIVHRAPCLALAGVRARGAGAALVLPSYGGEPGHLAGARAEAANLSRRYPSAPKLQGKEATPRALAQLLSRPLGLIHFAGHGMADLEPGTTPELLLDGAGSVLDVAQATATPVKAGLILLASCSAGQAARFRDGERKVAQVAYTDVLLAAGAGAVVAASWRVKDRLSAQLMTDLHQYLSSKDPAAALRAAQLNIRRRLELAHPRLWGAYTLYGGWR